MWTLIKKECTEVFIYAIVIGLIAAGSILFSAYLPLVHCSSHQKYPDMGWFVFGFFITALILAAVGASRTVLDRTHGFSTFYTSHLTTRKHIFAARLAAGLCMIAIYCIPVAIWLLYQAKLVHVDSGFTLNLQSPFMIRLTLLAVLILTACFNLGLNMGLSSKRIIYSLGILCLCVLLFTVVVIGGFRYSTIAILLLLNASLLYTCRKHYLTMSL